MPVFYPLMALAAIFAGLAAFAWMRVAIVSGKHSADFSRSSRTLRDASTATGLAFGLAALAVLVPLAVSLFV